MSNKPQKKTTGFYIEEDLLEKISEIAIKERQSVSAIINKLMEKYIKEYENKKG